MAITRSQLVKVKVEPLSIVRAIWKHAFLGAAIWFLVSAGAVLVVRRMPSIYRAETKILVESQRIPEKFVESAIHTDLRDRLNALSQQILSYRNLLTIAQNYKLYSDHNPPLMEEEIVTNMRSDTDVRLIDNWAEVKTASTKPTAFAVSYQGSDPRIVALVANELGGLFIDQNMKARQTEAKSTSDFLVAQLTEAQKRLEQQEAKVTEYKLQHSGELPEQGNALSASMSHVQTELKGVQEALQRAEQQRTILNTSIAAAEASQTAFLELAKEIDNRTAAVTPDPVTGAPAPTISVRESEVLEKQLVALRLKGYTDKHPDTRALLDAIARARKAEASADAAQLQQPAKGADGEKPPARADSVAKASNASPGIKQVLLHEQERVENLRGERQALLQQIVELEKERTNLGAAGTALQKRLERLPVREQELAILTRDYQTSQTDYKSLLDKKMAAEMSADMEHNQSGEKFTPVDLAHVPERPVKPNRPLLCLSSSMIGLFLGILIGPLIEFKRNVLMGDWELPKNVAIMAHVPVIRGPSKRGRKASGGRQSAGLGLADTGYEHAPIGSTTTVE